jgi:hypothetical protein
MKMLITKEFAAYNDRRYGKPWAARLTISPDLKLQYEFIGNWSGNRGSSGKLFFQAEPGTYVATGQKDHRGNGTSRDYYLVQEDGSLKEIDKADLIQALASA